MKQPQFTLLLMALSITFAIIVGSCASYPTQHQRIAFACEGIAASANAIALATEAGRISKARALNALRIAAPTKAFCQPVPVESLRDADYGVLIAAAASLAAMQESAQ